MKLSPRQERLPLDEQPILLSFDELRGRLDPAGQVQLETMLAHIEVNGVDPDTARTLSVELWCKQLRNRLTKTLACP